MPAVLLDPQRRYHELRTAVIIPCFNEEAAIGQVISDFKRELPDANIYVFDNNSVDRTAEIARMAGATVAFEWRQGKGNVVKTMFQEVDADIYIMVDGDATYPAHKVHDLLHPILSCKADMVVGSRLLDETSDMNGLNRLGNHLFLLAINLIFHARLTDVLSGYRVMTREFIRGICLLSRGFEIETELTIQALTCDMRVVEVPVRLSKRPPGGESKIKIMSDGVKICFTILDLFRTYKPLTVFGGAGALMILIGWIFGLSVILEYLDTGLVPRFPTAILAASLVLSGLLSLSVGLILNTLTRSFREMRAQIMNLDKRIDSQVTPWRHPSQVFHE